MGYIFWRFIIYLFFKILFDFRIYGKENVPDKGAVIVASNHESFLDPMIVGAGAHRPLVFLARDTLFKVKVIGPLLRSVGVIPLKREGGDLNAFRLAIKKLQEGKALSLFPEGTRSLDGNLQNPKSGVGFLTVVSGAEVVPCYVKGTIDAWHRDEKFPRLFSRIAVYYGKPIRFDVSVSGDKKSHYMYIAEEVMKGIRKLKEEA